jgi:tetratricopeptide (TPR) repeat protein
VLLLSFVAWPPVGMPRAQSQGKPPSELIPAQSKGTADAKPVIIEEPQVLDERLAGKGVDGRSVAETLRFILSMQADVEPIVAGTRQQPSKAVYKLSSVIYRFQNSTLWSGDIVGPTGTRGRLGPVTVRDESGLTANALTEIAIVIGSYLRRPLGGDVRAVNLGVDCFNQAGPMARDVTADFADRLRRIDAAGIYWVERAKADCRKLPGSLEKNVAVVGGWIDVVQEDNWLIRPVLWQGGFPGALPIAFYVGSFDDFFRDRDEYFTLVGKTVAAVLGNEYSVRDMTDTIAAAQLTSDVEAAKKGKALLNDGLIHLAVPLLQRGAKVGNAESLFDLGTAYQSASAFRFAERTFRQAIKIDPRHERSHMELGGLLFNQRKFKEAADEFRSAGTTPGARFNLAVTLYLLNDRSGARSVAEQALAAREDAREMSLLLARLDLGDRKYKQAIKRLMDGLRQDQQDVEAYAAVLRSVAAAALRDKEFEVAEEAYTILVKFEPTANNNLMFGRGMVSWSAKTGLRDPLLKAVRPFQKALAATAHERSEYPQLKVIGLDLAEAQFVAGDYQAAHAVASDFLIKDAMTDPSDPAPTRSYVPVAKLLIVASEYMMRRNTEPPIDRIKREIPEQVPAPELYLRVARSTGEPRLYSVDGWSFAWFDKHVCTNLPDADRDVVIGISTYVQQKAGADLRDGCEGKRG